MSAFLGKPTGGGILTILNCLLWVPVVVGFIATDESFVLRPLAILALALSLPIAWSFILPTLGDRSSSAGFGLVMACVMIGVNSLLWGYSISWLWSVTVGRRRKT